ncbi:hypothetical protein FGO68_gene8142 [Halteria grandinella]|uniref:Potassium channel domain-containing protein n=1 Tax=Halteria grandinella TaxID=5974 RepID=A0A8J8P5I0_HALGN|nr:hypothetical protein FGO68_gene8142 [Halteria grandinella]
MLQSINQHSIIRRNGSMASIFSDKDYKDRLKEQEKVKQTRNVLKNQSNSLMVRLSMTKSLFGQNNFKSQNKLRQMDEGALAKMTTPEPIKIENLDEGRRTVQSQHQFRSFTNSAISKSGMNCATPQNRYGLHFKGKSFGNNQHDTFNGARGTIGSNRRDEYTFRDDSNRLLLTPFPKVQEETLRDEVSQASRNTPLQRKKSIKRKRTQQDLIQRNIIALEAIKAENEHYKGKESKNQMEKASSSGNFERAVLNLENVESFDQSELKHQTQLNLKVEEKFYKVWRIMDLVASLFSVLGLIISIYAHEMHLEHHYHMVFSDDLEHRQRRVSQADLSEEAENERNMYHSIVAGLTFVSILIMTLKHYYMSKWMRQLYKFAVVECLFRPMTESRQIQLKKLSRSSFLKSKQFYVDIIMLIIQPIPYFNPTFYMTCIDVSDKTQHIKVEYALSHILLSLMFIRIIFPMRALFNFSIYTDQHAKKLLGDNYGLSPNVRFILKCMIAQYPEFTVSFILSASILIVAYILRIFEIVYYRAIGLQDFEQYFEGIYCAVITMATVGYGDVAPVSHVGRFIIMITSIWGAFIFTLVIVAFSMIFNLNPTQKKAMHHLIVTRKAAATIANSWRYYRAKKMKGDQQLVDPLTPRREMMLQRQISFSLIDHNIKGLKSKMDQSISTFKLERTQLKMLKFTDGNESRKNITFIKGEILDMQEKFTDVLNAMTSQMEAFNAITNMVTNIKEDQQDFQQHVINQQIGILNALKQLGIETNDKGVNNIIDIKALSNNDMQFEANYVSSENHDDDESVGGEEDSFHEEGQDLDQEELNDYGEEQYSRMDDANRDFEGPIKEEEEETSNLQESMQIEEPIANQILSAEIRKTLTNQQNSMRESVQRATSKLDGNPQKPAQTKSLYSYLINGNGQGSNLNNKFSDAFQLQHMKDNTGNCSQYGSANQSGGAIPQIQQNKSNSRIRKRSGHKGPNDTMGSQYASNHNSMFPMSEHSPHSNINPSMSINLNDSKNRKKHDLVVKQTSRLGMKQNTLMSDKVEHSVKGMNHPALEGLPSSFIQVNSPLIKEIREQKNTNSIPQVQFNSVNQQPQIVTGAFPVSAFAQPPTQPSQLQQPPTSRKQEKRPQAQQHRKASKPLAPPLPPQIQLVSNPLPTFNYDEDDDRGPMQPKRLTDNMMSYGAIDNITETQRINQEQ